MKSYVKEFDYPHNGETTKRKCFVMRETSIIDNDTKEDVGSFDGIELTYLSEDEQKKVVETLKDHEVKNGFTSGETIDNFNSDWNKAWRRYNKSKIIKG